MSTPARIAVAMSGGVDSTLAAALLVEQGQQVFGVMLRLWSENGSGENRCCSPQAMADARAAAAQLGMPFYVLDARQPFRQQVVSLVIEGYSRGLTPNPCLECNRGIRWGWLLEHALALGATHLATGHYARLRDDGGRRLLLRGLDPAKDQSYALSALGQDALQRALFPLGELTKAEVRRLAAARRLPCAARPESQDLCFLNGTDYRAFLRAHATQPDTPGPILAADGARLGTHSGLTGYTIGQRKGIGIGGGPALYVMDKDLERNILWVGPREALGVKRFHVGPLRWVAGEPPAARADVSVQVRYRGPEVPARLFSDDPGSAVVELARPLPDVSPGQAAVFYDGEVCLGGGTIRP